MIMLHIDIAADLAIRLKVSEEQNHQREETEHTA